MSDEPKIEVVRVPALDTGIGREAGFADDAALIVAAEAERAAMEALLTPETRDRLAKAEADLERRMLFGDGREALD